MTPPGAEVLKASRYLSFECILSLTGFIMAGALKSKMLFGFDDGGPWSMIAIVGRGDDGASLQLELI